MIQTNKTHLNNVAVQGKKSADNRQMPASSSDILIRRLIGKDRFSLEVCRKKEERPVTVRLLSSYYILAVCLPHYWYSASCNLLGCNTQSTLLSSHHPRIAMQKLFLLLLLLPNPKLQPSHAFFLKTSERLLLSAHHSLRSRQTSSPIVAC